MQTKSFYCKIIPSNKLRKKVFLMKKKTIKTLLIPVFALCFLVTTSTTTFTSNIPEDTTFQIIPLEDLPSYNNPANNT